MNLVRVKIKNYFFGSWLWIQRLLLNFSDLFDVNYGLYIFHFAACHIYNIILRRVNNFVKTIFYIFIFFKLLRHIFKFFKIIDGSWLICICMNLVIFLDLTFICCIMLFWLYFKWILMQRILNFIVHFHIIFNIIHIFLYTSLALSNILGLFFNFHLACIDKIICSWLVLLN
jgi:hypothetical protein